MNRLTLGKFGIGIDCPAWCFAYRSPAIDRMSGPNSHIRRGVENVPIVAVIAIAFVLSASVVTAQQNPIEARQALMKSNSAQAKIGAAMAKGEAAFDLAKAKQIFVTFQQNASRLPSLFPPNSKTGGDTRASPKIWEDMAGFKASAAKFAAEAKAAEAAIKDLESFKAQFANVTQNCGGCHREYRTRRN